MKAMDITDKYLEMQKILCDLKGESCDLRDSVEELLKYLSSSEEIQPKDKVDLLNRSRSMIEGIEELLVVEEKYLTGLSSISKTINQKY